MNEAKDLNQNLPAETLKAYLREDISYNKDGKEVVVKQNTLVLVDIERGIALIGEDHVDIYPEEYQVLAD